MQSLFIQYVFLILIILALVMLAEKLKIAYPIILVTGGLLISFLSFIPRVSIDHQAVFFIFLPPLLYEAAWQVSWKEFWKFRRVITSFAFPIVILTSCVVAVVAKNIIPGFTWALGFLLGGIVSPPDAVSATTIMRRVSVPKSMLSIIEGESLLNDASSLIVFRFALAAAVTGAFSFQQAAGNFFLVVSMGTLIGIAVGFIFYAIHRFLPTTSGIDVALTLVTPYCMYYAAEQFHFSGVLSVVSGGLLLSHKRQSMLTYRSRLEGVNTWSNLIFVLNGLVFLLIGLQLPAIMEQLGATSLTTAIGYGLIISFVLIVARFACAYGAALFTRFAAKFITVADARPGWKAPTIIGWTGMRGVVSLAAALSIPEFIGAEAFPHRNLILFITFIVILVTLVLQGLTLPWVIRKVKPEDRFHAISEQEQELIIQKKMTKYSLDFVEKKYGEERKTNPHLNNLLNRLETDLNYYRNYTYSENSGDNTMENFQRMYLEVLDEQRRILKGMNHREEFDEDLIRKYLSLVDMEELKVRQKILSDPEPM